MNIITNNERKTVKSEKLKKALNIIKKVLIYTAVAVAVVLVLGLLWQIIQYVFTAALLFIAWLFPFRR